MEQKKSALPVNGEEDRISTSQRNPISPQKQPQTTTSTTSASSNASTLVNEKNKQGGNAVNYAPASTASDNLNELKEVDEGPFIDENTAKAMPTSSGHDRTNYSTTKQFGKAGDNSDYHLVNLNNANFQRDNIRYVNTNNLNDGSMTNRSSSNSVNGYLTELPTIPKRTDYGQKASHRALNKLNKEYVDINEPDSPFVCIQDPKLREIVKKLVRAERDRDNFNLDPNLVTQIDHKGYSLFFSRNGSNPFEMNYQSTKVMSHKNIQTEISSNQIQEYTPQLVQVKPAPQPQIIQLTPMQNKNPTTVPLDPNKSNVNYVDNTGNKYVIADANVNPNQIEIPPEVNRIIQQDMLNNPSKSGERTYKIVAHNKDTNQPQVIRLVVKSKPNPVAKTTESLPVLVTQKPIIIQAQSQQAYMPTYEIRREPSPVYVKKITKLNWEQ